MQMKRVGQGEHIARPRTALTRQRCRSYTTGRSRRDSSLLRGTKYTIDIVHSLRLASAFDGEREDRTVPLDPDNLSHR